MDRISYELMALLEEDHWWFVSRRKIIKKILDKYVTKNTKNNILEIGCGTGGNLKLLSNYGEIYATEIDEYAREQANAKNICQVKYGKLPNKLPFKNSFDTICLFDVLEHIEDDSSSLNKIRGYLKNNGKVIITVPAYMFLWSGHDVSNHHKRRYTRKQINRLLLGSGYKITYSSYFNSILFPIVAFIRLVKKFFSENIEDNDVKKEQYIINKLMQKIFSFESKFLPKVTFPFGVSIFVIGEKISK